jgi:hypothetical protein
MYLNILLSVIVEIPVVIMCYFLIENQNYGRKFSIFISFLVTSAGSFLIFFLKENYFF